MRPESTSITLRRDLTQVAQEFDDANATKGFIADRAAPILETDEDSGTYPIFNREAFRKPANTARAEGAAYNRIIAEFGSGTFACEEHGLEYPIDARRRKRYSSSIDARAMATRVLRHQILLAKERRVSALYVATGLTSNSPTAAWSDTSNAKPLTDILTGFQVIEDKCGCSRDDLRVVMPRADVTEFLATDQVTNKSLYTFPGIQPAELQAAQIAAILGCREVLIPRSVYDSADEGIAESITQVWTAGTIYTVLLCGENDPLDIPSAFRTMVWTQNCPQLPVVESYDEPTIRGEVVRMLDDTDEVATAEADLMAYEMTT